MRIAIDARPFSVPKTGVGHYMYNVIKMLSPIDHKNEYFLYSNHPFELDLPDANLHKRIDNSRIGTLWLHTKIPLLLKQDNIDLFWGPNFTIPKIPKGIAKVLGIHDMVHHYYPDTLPKQIVLHQKYFLPYYAKWADLIIADSYSTKNDIIEVINVPEDKIRVTHLAADRKTDVTAHDETILKNMGINRRKYLLYVGTIEPRKNIEGIIRSYARLVESIKETPALVIAGGWGWKYENIKGLVDESHLGDRVIFTDYVGDKELSVLYQNAGIFLFPSFYEGFGLPPLEAMSYGIPVICSNNSSLPEVVGDAAITVNPYDDNELYNSMRQLLTNEELRKSISEKSIKRSKIFSWEKTARETLAIFEEAFDLKKNKLTLK